MSRYFVDPGVIPVDTERQIDDHGADCVMAAGVLRCVAWMQRWRLTRVTRLGVCFCFAVSVCVLPLDNVLWILFAID